MVRTLCTIQGNLSQNEDKSSEEIRSEFWGKFGGVQGQPRGNRRLALLLTEVRLYQARGSPAFLTTFHYIASQHYQMSEEHKLPGYFPSKPPRTLI